MEGTTPATGSLDRADRRDQIKTPRWDGMLAGDL